MNDNPLSWKILVYVLIPIGVIWIVVNILTDNPVSSMLGTSYSVLVLVFALIQLIFTAKGD